MTTPFRSVGCCVDHSRAAAAAIDAAVGMRDRGEASAIVLVHAIEPPPALHAGPYTYVEPDDVARADARRWLDEQLAAAPGASGVVLVGDPAKAICAWAAESGVDLLIVAPHRGPVDRAIHGSVAGHLAYHAPCPVLMVRPAG